MATLTTTGKRTLIESVIAEHNEKLLPVVNVLSQVIELFRDAQWIMCNNRTSHKVARVATEPSGTYVDYNEGIDPVTGTKDVVEEPTCMLEALSQIDARLLKHSVDGNAERMAEDQIILNRLGKDVAYGFFYETRNSGNNKGKVIDGLGNRVGYKTLADAYVYDNAKGETPSATANKMSLWLIGWGDKKVQMLYPRNDAPGGQSPDGVEGLGIKMTPYPEDWVYDANNKPYRGYRTLLQMHYGIVIFDPRYIRRQVNISATGNVATGDYTWDEEVLMDAIGDLPDLEGAAIYVPRKLRTQIWKRAKNLTSPVEIVDDQVFGKRIATFMGIPVRLVDQLLATESKVT